MHPLPLLVSLLVGPYLQDARPDGAVVVWETEADTDGAVIVETPAGERRFPSPRGKHHEVLVSGLAAGHYKYRLDGPDAAAGELTTLPTGDELTFLVYGDDRDRDADHARVVAAMEKESADLAINTGDLTGDAGDEALWRRFFAIEEPLLSRLPLYPALGNHELLHDPTALHFHRYFALPGPIPEGEHTPTERYYHFRAGPALFIALDGNESHSLAQARFLEKTLDEADKDPSVRHVFVFFHQPPFSSGDFCGSAAEQGLWVPEIERHHVRAVFTGHDHSYQRLVRNGIRYFVTGGGGAPLHNESTACPPPDRHALRLYKAVHHYLRVRLRGDRADLEAVDVDGNVFDRVALSEPPVPAPTPPPPIEYKDAPLVADVTAEARDAKRRTATTIIFIGAILFGIVGVIALRKKR